MYLSPTSTVTEWWSDEGRSEAVMRWKHLRLKPTHPDECKVSTDHDWWPPMGGFNVTVTSTVLNMYSSLSNTRFFTPCPPPSEHQIPSHFAFTVSYLYVNLWPQQCCRRTTVDIIKLSWRDATIIYGKEMVWHTPAIWKLLVKKLCCQYYIHEHWRVVHYAWLVVSIKFWEIHAWFIVHAAFTTSFPNYSVLIIHSTSKSDAEDKPPGGDRRSPSPHRYLQKRCHAHICVSVSSAWVSPIKRIFV